MLIRVANRICQNTVDTSLINRASTGEMESRVGRAGAALKLNAYLKGACQRGWQTESGLPLLRDLADPDQDRREQKWSSGG